MAIHRLTLQKSLVENNERRRSKYEDIEWRLSLRVRNYFRENNKLQYLQSYCQPSSANLVYFTNLNICKNS